MWIPQVGGSILYHLYYHLPEELRIEIKELIQEFGMSIRALLVLTLILLGLAGSEGDSKEDAGIHAVEVFFKEDSLWVYTPIHEDVFLQRGC